MTIVRVPSFRRHCTTSARQTVDECIGVCKRWALVLARSWSIRIDCSKLALKSRDNADPVQTMLLYAIDSGDRLSRCPENLHDLYLASSSNAFTFFTEVSQVRALTCQQRNNLAAYPIDIVLAWVGLDPVMCRRNSVHTETFSPNCRNLSPSQVTAGRSLRVEALRSSPHGASRSGLSETWWTATLRATQRRRTQPHRPSQRVYRTARRVNDAAASMGWDHLRSRAAA